MTHFETGEYSECFEEIERAVQFIKGKGYTRIIGYGFSTGGAILSSYVVEKGDALFDAFVFNSPFLDCALGWPEGSPSGEWRGVGGLRGEGRRQSPPLGKV